MISNKPSKQPIKNILSIQNSKNNQAGYTLIELMIALVLGLLISAAAFQVFYTSQRTSTTQKSASEVQDSAIFGLQLLERHLKLVNLGAASPIMNGTTSKGGIVLTTTNTSLTNQDLFTKQDATADTTTGKSDQLTIQFVAPQNMLDCQGSVVAVGTMVQQRYFIKDNNLVCAAQAKINGNGEILIPNVDHFKVLLMTDKGYKKINDYDGTTPIRGIKLGLILSGTTPTIQAQGNSDLKVFGEDVNLNKTAPNTIRRVFEPTIIFRNARS